MRPNQVQLALLALSTILAIAYGAFGSGLYEGAPPYAVGTIFKASSIIILVLIALWSTDGRKLKRAAPDEHAARSAALQPANT